MNTTNNFAVKDPFRSEVFACSSVCVYVRVSSSNSLASPVPSEFLDSDICIPETSPTTGEWKSQVVCQWRSGKRVDDLKNQFML